MSEESVRFSTNNACHAVTKVQDLYANTIFFRNTPRCFVPQHDKKNNTFRKFYCLMSIVLCLPLIRHIHCMPMDKLRRGTMQDMFEYPIKMDNGIEATLVGDFGNVFGRFVDEQLAGFFDSDFI